MATAMAHHQRFSVSHGIAGNVIGRGFCVMLLSMRCASGPRFSALPVAVRSIWRTALSSKWVRKLKPLTLHVGERVYLPVYPPRFGPRASCFTSAITQLPA
jgi:hypothetical protein